MTYALSPARMGAALAVFFPRVLVIILVYLDRGFGGWLIAHAIALAIIYAGSGKQQHARSCPRAAAVS